MDYVSNDTLFKCFYCNEQHNPHAGVILKECLHLICIKCITYVVLSSRTSEVKCPYIGDSKNVYKCQAEITQREIKGFLSKFEYEEYLNNTLKFLKDNYVNKCFKPNCNGMGWIEVGINNFSCSLCRSVNCISCEVSKRYIYFHCICNFH